MESLEKTETLGIFGKCKAIKNVKLNSLPQDEPTKFKSSDPK